jgi:hypothetical protein
MEKSGAGIVGVAIIWAAVIFGSALILKDTPYFSQILTILGGGAASCLIILGGTRPEKTGMKAV